MAVTAVMPISIPIFSLTPFLSPTAAALERESIVFGPGVMDMTMMYTISSAILPMIAERCIFCTL